MYSLHYTIMATTIDRDEVKYLFAELNRSINKFYMENSALCVNGSFSMNDILKNAAKMEYYLDGRFEHLWNMEREERIALEQILQNREQYRPESRRKRALSEESVDPFPEPLAAAGGCGCENALPDTCRRDSCSSMPPLMPFSEAYPDQNEIIPDTTRRDSVDSRPGERPVLNPEDEDEGCDHSQIPYENDATIAEPPRQHMIPSIWRFSSNSLMGSILPTNLPR